MAERIIFDFCVVHRYDNRLMSMSEYIDPFKASKHGHSVQGQLNISEMPRLVKLLATPDGIADYSLNFAVDEDHFCVINGQLQANCEVTCQRCLQTFTHQLKCVFVVSPIKKDEQAKGLPDDYEPVMVSEDKLNLAELIEDEFILAMPLVPMHEPGTKGCVEIENVQDKQTINPFEVLQNLKGDK